MTTQNSSQPGDLFFEPIVNGYLSNTRFVRRDWLAEEIDHRLSTDGSRFVLLTAEPGFGKSALMVQLAADHPNSLVNSIRRARAGCLWNRLQHEQREEVLGFCADDRLFKPPVLAPAILAAISGHIVEVCREWEWL